MGFLGFGLLHVFKTPDPHKDGLSPALLGEGEREPKLVPRQSGLLCGVTHVQNLMV